MVYLNKTETMALEWLINERGYKKEDVNKTNNTPDFVCEDGKRYEVKYLYANKIIFNGYQSTKMKNEDIVIVFDNRGFCDEFLWGDRDKINKYKIIANVTYNISLFLKDKRTRTNFKKMLSNFSGSDEAVKSILRAYYLNPILFERTTNNDVILNEETYGD